MCFKKFRFVSLQFCFEAKFGDTLVCSYLPGLGWQCAATYRVEDGGVRVEVGSVQLPTGLRMAVCGLRLAVCSYLPC